jgi:predicted RNA-binding protein YlxR (DUF448 family)
MAHPKPADRKARAAKGGKPDRRRQGSPGGTAPGGTPGGGAPDGKLPLSGSRPALAGAPAAVMDRGVPRAVDAVSPPPHGGRGRRSPPAAAVVPAGAPAGAPDDARPATPAGVPADASGDAAEDPPEKGPLRRCLVTRESRAKETMLRFVLGPERELVPDLAGRLPGRGMWLSAKADVLERALSRGAFAKAARGPTRVPPDLRQRIEDGLQGRVRDLLGFARRAGQAICGREQVREWLQSGKAGLLVEASDGSPAERARLIGRREMPVIAPLPAAVLGGIFGRDHAVHVAIGPGRMAAAIVAEATRLAGIRGEGT